MIIELKDKKIPIKWGLWAQREFCKRKDIPGVSQYAALLSDGDAILNVIPEMILVAAEYAAIKAGEEFKYTEIDVCEWIDEMGGFNPDSKVFEIFRYIVGGEVKLSEPIVDTEGEKKT